MKTCGLSGNLHANIPVAQQHELILKYQQATQCLALRPQTAWGSPNNSMAERLMLREALSEPRNQRFMLLSDSGVPLYPPTALWQHVMGAARSRIDACRPVSGVAQAE